MAFSSDILEGLRRSRVVAGFTVQDAARGVAIARALREGGIKAIELTLRTDGAMDAVRGICAEVPGMLVGVGTILTPLQAREAKAAGAHFGVAPGTNARVIEAAGEVGLPFAPGVSVASDVERALELGCRFLKFFPSEAMGGIPYLRSMSAPYKHLGVEFFPLGGINEVNMLEYLKEANIPAVGGSWIVREELVESGAWADITAAAARVSKQIEGS